MSSVFAANIGKLFRISKLFSENRKKKNKKQCYMTLHFFAQVIFLAGACSDARSCFFT